MAPDTPHGTKRLFLEKPSSSEPPKRVRVEQNHPVSEEKVASPDAIQTVDTPPESSSREKSAGRRDAAGWAKSRKGKEKQTKNVGRRREPRDVGPSEMPKNEENDGPKPPRLPKRMAALLLGFCGTGCSGMQMCVRCLMFRERRMVPLRPFLPVQVNRTSERSRVSCSTRWFVQEPCPRTMPTIPPKCFTVHIPWLFI